MQVTKSMTDIGIYGNKIVLFHSQVWCKWHKKFDLEAQILDNSF